MLHCIFHPTTDESDWSRNEWNCTAGEVAEPGINRAYLKYPSMLVNDLMIFCLNLRESHKLCTASMAAPHHGDRINAC